MISIYQRALGSDFSRLHPEIQRRFGFSSADGVACIGRGVMDEIWKGRFYTVPFLYVGTWRRIMFPETGRNIPFTIENYAFVDQFGRETVTWIRTFQSRRTRRFDAYMIYSEAHRRIVDYLGSHEHLAVDIDLSVDEKGGLRLRSGAQRFYVSSEAPLRPPRNPSLWLHFAAALFRLPRSAGRWEMSRRRRSRWLSRAWRSDRVPGWVCTRGTRTR